MAPVDQDFHTAPPSGEVTGRMGISLKQQCDKQSMKTAILNQEAIFRQQVHELHRLYRVQKQLMRNAKDTRLGNENGSCCQPCYSHRDEGGPRRAIDLERPAEECTGYELESDLELTLATGCRRKKRGMAMASYTSDSSSSSVSGGSKLATVLRSRFPSSDQHRSFDLEKPQTPWILPCLSLKMA
ncbi:uncharacterized protein M6B38_185435 [Iris pallida]|uniref:Uncharacterized protein n=1 Tax=Iris pallida TaxID=29817 RepID=A0AAX6ELC1_IRIPA|nr:uncharacterized protein M6B38_185435 [Iris pallida]